MVKIQNSFKKRILYKYDVDYFQCKSCGALFTEKPYWLEKAYSSAIANADTEVIQCNLEDRWIIGNVVKCFYNKEGNCLDYGGGYGIFVRLMRDKGVELLLV